MTLKKKLVALFQEIRAVAPNLAEAGIRELAVLEDISSVKSLDVNTLADDLKINSKQAAERAVITYSTNTLLAMPADIRAVVCRALLVVVPKFDVTPNPVWSRILSEPAFFEKWALEEYGNENTVVVETDTPVAPILNTDNSEE